MKLAFSTIGCPEWSWNEIMEAAIDMRIDGIEIRGVEDELNALRIGVFQDENKEKTLHGLKSRDIEIPMMATSICLGQLVDGGVDMEEARQAVDFAAKIGIPFIRTLISLPPQPEAVDELAAQRRYQQLCQYAKGKNICVLIETNGILADSSKMARFLEGADPASSGVLWDIHHPYRFFHETPAQTYKTLGDKIKYVHVKDSAMVQGKVEYRMMGFGDVPVFDAVKILHQNGYSGYITLEWVKRWHPTLREPDVVFYHFQSYMETLLTEIELGA